MLLPNKRIKVMLFILFLLLRRRYTHICCLYVINVYHRHMVTLRLHTVLSIETTVTEMSPGGWVPGAAG